MKNYSIWSDIKTKHYPKLNENKVVDVLIIGGGMTGISTLYNLKDSNLNVMLVEQSKIGMSTTSRSTGKLTFLQNDLLDKIKNKCGEENTLLYLKSQIDIINNIVNIIDKEKIDCNLEKVDSYLYTNKDNEVDKIKELESFLNKNNINTYKQDNALVNSKYSIYVKDTYIFNPIKFLFGLLKNNKYPIYEDTSIIKIEKEEDYYKCYTKEHYIKAKYVVIASHYPYFMIPYLFPFKVKLNKSYLSASKKDIKPVSLISYSNPFISIRTYKDYIVYLSNSHDINKDVCDRQNFDELLKKLEDLKLKPDYLWSNIDIMTSDGLPIIGRIKDNMFIGTGFNTWGLTNGFLSGKIISDMVLNKKNVYSDLFNPNRKLITASNIINNIDGFIKGIINGSDYTCPHMGCKLIYNELEETYDCPCHGSRFNSSGKCISSPSKKDIF